MKPDQKYIFCVIGNKKYIDELNQAIQLLIHFTKKEIIVLTDLDRNEGTINHSNILNVETPKRFDNHQASIYLKTGAHKFLDLNYQYCYLDSDIFVVNNRIDEVFDYYQKPISFGLDGSSIRTFSRSAIHLPTISKEYPKVQSIIRDAVINERQERTKKRKIITLKINEKFWQQKRAVSSISSYIVELLRGLVMLNPSAYKVVLVGFLFTVFWILGKVIKPIKQKLGYGLNSQFIKTFYALKYHLEDAWLKLIGFYSFCQTEGFEYQLKSEKWLDKDGNAFYQNNELFHAIQESGEGLIDPYEEDKLWTRAGKVTKICDWSEGLVLAIKEKFDVIVSDLDFNQWNGGLFLFDADSVNFLDTWHEYTMAIFEEPVWKTRDQGTLIATVWKYGLENHPNVPLEFNFLDPVQKYVTYLGDFTFKVPSRTTEFKPIGLHFFNGFGAENSPIRKDLAQMMHKTAVS